MNKNKWITMAAVVALSASMAVAAPHADKAGGKFGGKRGHGEFGARLAEKLNLTEAQKAQIKTIRDASRDQNMALFEQSRETFRQFRDAKQANDTARLQQLQPLLEQQRAQLKQVRESERQLIVAILTPQQRTQFEALKADREAHRGQRGEHGKRNRQ